MERLKKLQRFCPSCPTNKQVSFCSFVHIEGEIQRPGVLLFRDPCFCLQELTKMALPRQLKL